VQVESGGTVPARVKYGYVWTCLGTPGREIVDFPECTDPERWVVTGGAIGVAVCMGWWTLHLQETTGNPLFPYFNDYWKSPLALRAGAVPFSRLR